MGHYPAMKRNKHGYMHQHGSMLEKHNYTYKTGTIMGGGEQKNKLRKKYIKCDPPCKEFKKKTYKTKQCVD